MQPVFLITDLFIAAVILWLLVYALRIQRDPHLLSNWRLAFRRPMAMFSGLTLLLFILIALLDSIHYRVALPAVPGQSTRYSAEVVSLLDQSLQHLTSARERSYSAPLSARGFRKESFELDGQKVRDYPRLSFGGAHLKDPERELTSDILLRSYSAMLWAFALIALITIGALFYASYQSGHEFKKTLRQFLSGKTEWPWRTIWLTLSVMFVVVFWIVLLSQHYHVFGTDRTGNSVLLLALKSIRTALVIGCLTTLVVLPLALLMGILAGFMRGWIDELIQYIYTMLASIPDVLLIAASVLLLQVFIDKNQNFFDTALERSDIRLFFLCLILGITSFTGLCRLVRGETLKLRELEYIQSARAMGVPTIRILQRHILPNLMHLVLINTVMQFSGFVLAEAVLSYVGVGVDPKTASFGVMINTARSELAATPVVWWTLASAFIFMFLMVLSANLLADAIRDAFDPRTRLRRAPVLGEKSSQPIESKVTT